jgi:acetoacetate decarboxylase
VDVNVRDRSGAAPGLGVAELVDAALARASRREVFTADEALALLHGLVAEMGDAPIRDIADAMVSAAVAGYCDALLIPRSRVVDPLLDLRLVVSG